MSTSVAAGAAHAPRGWDEHLTIGVVVKPQGRRGEVLVEPLSDRPERFPGLKAVRVLAPSGSGVQALAVTSAWPHKGRWVLKFEGVDSIDEAERYRNRELRLAPGELEPLPEHTYYEHQLRGLRVQGEDGVELGLAGEVLKTGAGADVLSVRGPRGEHLVALHDDFVVRVDLQAGVIVVRNTEMVDEC